MTRILYGAIATGIACVVLGLLFYYGILSLNSTISLDTTQIGVIVASVGLVITTAFSVQMYRYQRKVAEESVFKKAVLEVSVMGQRLVPNSEFSEIDFGYSVGKDDGVFCVIPFVIRNIGELSAENVHVRLVFPLLLRGVEGLMNNIEFGEILGIYDASDIKRRAYRYEGFECVDYLLPEVGPHAVGVVQEPIDVTYSSAIPIPEVKAVSKDKVPLAIKLGVPVVSKVSIEVSAKDIMPASGHFRVRSFEAKNMKELQDKITKDRANALKKMNDDPRASEMEKADLLKNAIAVMPELKKVPKSKGDPQVKETVYVEEPKKSRIALLQTSEYRRLGLRLPDGRILIRKLPDT